MPSLFDGLPPHEPSAANGFAGNRIDRRSEARSEDAVATALGDRSARLYLFQADKALLKAGDDPLFTVAEAEGLGAAPDGAVLLGWTAEGPRLATGIAEATGLDEDRIKAIDLRSLAVQGTVSAEHLGALAQARSLAYWHARHGFCSVCGAKSAMKAGGYRRDCTACGAEHFPRTDPVVIMLSVDGDRCLLGRQPRFMPGMYSCLAGFLEPGETIEDAVRREIAEEAGIRSGRVRYHSSQPWPFPSSLMIGCHAEAASTAITRDETELEDCRWFPRDEVRTILDGSHAAIRSPPPMAIAHRLIRAWVESG